ncbi:hypothetical protein GCK72_007107 [Caenorhabditis remanei]|uniref:Uncharacterized protein n=1 Tax=Caenorhabditis remanei TaxID=31234 RepID=A0A6A5HH40_CAERE|nr:hypothetical protein GCK72_007107 [Caenorhabditis remanei]KAF1767148.1 hypothetical protein GCK72_007107 [Caenorhabditis remanei]
MLPIYDASTYFQFVLNNYLAANAPHPVGPLSGLAPSLPFPQTFIPAPPAPTLMAQTPNTPFPAPLPNQPVAFGPLGDPANEANSFRPIITDTFKKLRSPEIINNRVQFTSNLVGFLICYHLRSIGAQSILQMELNTELCKTLSAVFDQQQVRHNEFSFSNVGTESLEPTPGCSTSGGNNQRKTKEKGTQKEEEQQLHWYNYFKEKFAAGCEEFKTIKEGEYIDKLKEMDAEYTEAILERDSEIELLKAKLLRKRKREATGDGETSDAKKTRETSECPSVPSSNNSCLHK